MPFFDQPGSQAGPYSTPAQTGILTRILQGADVAMKLGNFYQNWQAQSQNQKTTALKDFASRVGITQALNQEGVAASPDMVTQAGELGIALPSMTDKMQTGMAAQFLPASVASTPGDMVTSPTDPAQVSRMAAQTQGMASLPAVGTAMIPGKQLTMDQVRMKALQGMEPGKQREALFPKTTPNITTVKRPDGSTYEVAGRYAQERPPGVTPGEWDRRNGVLQQNRITLKGTPGASGGGKGGRPEVMTAAKEKNEAFLKYIQIPGNENVTRVEFNTVWTRSQAEGRATQTTRETPERGKTITTRKPLSPKSKPGTRDEALDNLGSYGSDMVINPFGAPEPGGQKYELPKNGVMVPVDKETYDAYQKKYGQR